MRVLITGIGGMIGSNLAEYLIGKGNKVTGIDNFSGGYKDFVPNPRDCVEIDLATVEGYELQMVFDIYKPEVVYHFAAYAAEGLSPFIRQFNYLNNVVASAGVINECIRTGAKLVFASSIAVYGNIRTPYKEQQIPQPVDPYGIAKYAVEMDIKQAGDQFGLKYNIVRPHNVLGLNQNIWDRYRNVVGIWIHSILKGKPCLIYGDGTAKRAFSDIQFLLPAFEKMMTDDFSGRIYNLGSDKIYSLNELAAQLGEVAEKRGYSMEVKYVAGRHEVHSASSDHSAAKEELDFEDKTDLPDLLGRMFDWALTQPDRKVKTMKYEIEKGMYENWK